MVDLFVLSSNVHALRSRSQDQCSKTESGLKTHPVLEHCSRLNQSQNYIFSKLFCFTIQENNNNFLQLLLYLHPLTDVKC